MQHVMLQDKYPILTLEIAKAQTALKDLDAVIDYFQACITRHPIASWIANFDHCAHTRGLAEGNIAEDILAAKHLVFCFGKHLPNPQVMAVRPRSIGVVEKTDCFVISYLEAPMPLANQAMASWMDAIPRVELETA